MIRFAWREFRTQASVTLALLLIVAAVLAITGANLAHLYDTTVANCQLSGDCAASTSALVSTDAQLQAGLDVLITIVPLLLGIFWGAPLVAREFEAGTQRLAWTQSVTRTRWLAAKIGLTGTATVLATALLSLLVTWWFTPIDRVNMNVFSSFDQRDIVPIGYAAFAFALGVSAGALLRRTLPAMASTLVAFVGVRLLVNEALRPNFSAPLHTTVPNTVLGALASSRGPITPAQLAPGEGSLPPNAWCLTDQTVDRAGHVIGQNGLVGGAINLSPGANGDGLTIQGAGTCPGITLPVAPNSPGPAVRQCAAQLHIHDVLAYQPGSRYWPFQLVELAVFLALAIILVTLCFWWIRRHVG